MKPFQFILIGLCAMFTSPLFAQQNPSNRTDTIKVYGECGMCQKRIQKALKLEGIETATWNTETKLLIVNYNPKTISNDAIQKKVAAIGHDTEKYRAETNTYDNLPGCCHYERK